MGSLPVQCRPKISHEKIEKMNANESKSSNGMHLAPSKLPHNAHNRFILVESWCYSIAREFSLFIWSQVFRGDVFTFEMKNILKIDTCIKNSLVNPVT